MSLASAVAAATPTPSTGTVAGYIAQQQAQQAAATAAATAATAAAKSTTGGLSSNLNTFLNILTTQLKNQDPTSATDTNQFTQELVQFAGVEQQLNGNQSLTQLVNLQKNSSGLTATLNYIGKYVEAPTTTNQMSLQGSSAEIGYNLTAPGKSVSVAVTDASGNVVTTLTGSANSGMNYVSWNGQNSSGTTSPDGTYTFTVNATDPSGVTTAVTNNYTIGKVTGVTSNTDGTFALSVGAGQSLNASTVNAVYDATSLPAAT